MGRHHKVYGQDWNIPNWERIRKMGTYKSGGGKHRGSRSKGYHIRDTRNYGGKHAGSGCALTAFALVSIPAVLLTWGGYEAWSFFSTF